MVVVKSEQKGAEETGAADTEDDSVETMGEQGCTQLHNGYFEISVSDKNGLET